MLNFIDQLQSIDGVVVYKTLMLMYEHLDLNMENLVLRDQRVRRALAFATKDAVLSLIVGAARN